jgi:hypothetical protein
MISFYLSILSREKKRERRATNPELFVVLGVPVQK